MRDTFDARMLTKSAMNKLESKFTVQNGVMKGPVKLNINQDTLKKLKEIRYENE